MGTTGDDRSDAEDDSVDAQFRALLEGIRTSLPGVQVLFAFLLTAPLQGGFDDVIRRERWAFAIAFLSSGTASVLLIAPSVHQRIRAPFSGLTRHSERHLRIATWITIVGTAFMGLAIASTTYLVSELVFSLTIASIATGALSGALVWSWFYLPLVTFRESGSDG